MSSTTTATPQKPELKLIFLQGSRAIRIAWLLTELDLPYENVFFERNENKRAPTEMFAQSRDTMGKSPTLFDRSKGEGEGLVLAESGAITEYILENYDPTKSMFGNGNLQQKEEIRRFIHMSEGVFMIHLLAIPFARWFATPGCEELKKIEAGVLGMVWKDLDWLESHLQTTKTDYLVGNTLSAADTMMLYCIQLIFIRYCGGRTMDEWKEIKAWVERCEAREGWKRCVRETGHSLVWD